MSIMSKREKIRAQMKSRFYYMFWGAATVAVVGGQLYVGTSYRAMSKSLDAWFNTAIETLLERRGTYRPLVPPPTGDFGRDQIDLTELDPEDYLIWLETGREEI